MASRPQPKVVQLEEAVKSLTAERDAALAAVEAEKAARVKADADLSKYVAAVDVALGHDGTHAPEQVIGEVFNMRVDGESVRAEFEQLRQDAQVLADERDRLSDMVDPEEAEQAMREARAPGSDKAVPVKKARPAFEFVGAHFRRVFSEDDANRSDPHRRRATDWWKDHFGVTVASLTDYTVAVEDAGDAFYHLLPNGWVVCVSYDGEHVYEPVTPEAASLKDVMTPAGSGKALAKATEDEVIAKATALLKGVYADLPSVLAMVPEPFRGATTQRFEALLLKLGSGKAAEPSPKVTSEPEPLLGNARVMGNFCEGTGVAMKGVMQVCPVCQELFESKGGKFPPHQRLD